MENEPLMEAVDEARKLLELCAGYRAECEAKGFSPAASEMMAVDFHRNLITGVFAQANREND